jgi:hypothetical protein
VSYFRFMFGKYRVSMNILNVNKWNDLWKCKVKVK